MIQNQVTLPIDVAYGVAMQGMRIRLGRSLITIMGVVLGIAFLMAILTEQVVSEGVRGEEQLRLEVGRMYSFLSTEVGPADGRKMGFLQTGVLSVEEQRFLRRLEEEGLRKVVWTDLSTESSRERAPGGVSFEDLLWEPVDIADLGDGTSAVIVSGDGELSREQWATLREIAGEAVICSTRPYGFAPGVAGAPVSLGRELTQEEMDKAEAEARSSKFRNTWIVIISLVVTVIGISNAMLISVTERFREIATMKCLGALSRFIRVLFLIEASIVGLAGAIAGSILGIAFSLFMYGLVYEWGLVFASLDFGILIEYLGLSLVAGVVLSIAAAIYPAHIASSMVPADALRSNV